MVPTNPFLDGIHPAQLDCLKAFDSGLYKYFLTEWARRHRKTTLWLNICIREACRHTACAYAHIFPFQVEARQTVWDAPDMLPRYMPEQEEMGWKLDQQTMTIKFANGSIIKIGGADEPDRWRGPEWIGVVFDEAKHIKHEMWTTIIQPVMAGPLPPEKIKDGVRRWTAFAYTPEGINWTTQMFDSACMLGEGGTLPDCGRAEQLQKNYYASRLDGEKAGIMSAEALAEAMASMPKAMYDQEIRCSRITQEERTFITSAMLNDLLKINWAAMRAEQPQNRRIVSIDPAFGGDMCVLKGFENTRVAETVRRHPHKTSEIIYEAKAMAIRLQTKDFIVDCVGNGKGVADGLDEDVAGYNVQYFGSADANKGGDDSILCLNQRAAAYAFTGTQIRKQLVEPVMDKELLRQLPVAARYVVRRGRALCLPKDEIKKELGCSPDDADSYVMGIYGLQFVNPIGAREVVESVVQEEYDPLSAWR